MALISPEELELERKAQVVANDCSMADHADSCPYLISRRRQNCRCNCFTFALNNLRRSHVPAPHG